MNKFVSRLVDDLSHFTEQVLIDIQISILDRFVFFSLLRSQLNFGNGISIVSFNL